MLGVHLVALENFQAGGQQVFQFGIAGVRNQRRLERGVDRLVIGDLVVGVGLVERRAAQRFSSARLASACLTSDLLVSLSCGVTLSFLTSARA